MKRLAILIVAAAALLTCKAQRQETPKPVPGHTFGAVFDRPVGVYDLRDYGATPADIGPAILKAALAIQTAGAGIMELPALTGGAMWTWATSAQLTWQSIGNHAAPGYIELRSQEGAIVQLEEGASGFPTLYSIDNSSQQTWVVRNITFVGDPAHGDDVPRLFTMEAATVLLDGVNLYGVQGRDGLGIIEAIIQGKLTVQNSRLFGNARINPGGTIMINGGGLDLNNVEFGDAIVFNGISYNKSGSHVANVYIDGLTLPAQIRNCRVATQFAQTANIWVHCANGNPCNKVSISDSYINVSATPFGASSPPTILVDGPPGAVALSGGLDLVHNSFSDQGGHRDFQEPQLILKSTGAAQTRIVGNYTTSGIVANNLFDPTLWPAKGFKMSGGNGPVYVEEGATDTQGHILHPYLIGESPILSQNYNGVTTLYPCHGAIACYDAAEALTIGTGQQYTGTGGTFVPVTAGHHLYFSVTPNGALAVTFTGSESGVAAFLSAIQAVLPPGISAANVGGQIQITAGIMYGASSGVILNVAPYITDADVLTSLGFTAGASFNVDARVTAIGDNSGTGNALTGNVGLMNPDGTANSKSTLQFRTTDILSASISTLAQPFRIAFAGRQRIAVSNAYAFDGGIANQCGIFGVAAENTIRIGCGASAVGWPVTDTTQWHAYVFDVNGANSTVAVDSDTPFYAQNAGGSSLTGITLGNGGAGFSSAGWDIGEALVTTDMSAQTRHNLMAYLDRNRAIPSVYSPQVICPSGQVPSSLGTSNGGCVNAGAVSSVTGTSGVLCSPSTGAVSCSNTGATSVTGAGTVSCSPTTGAVVCTGTGGFACSSLSSCTGGQLPPTGIAPGNQGGQMLFTQGSGCPSPPCDVEWDLAAGDIIFTSLLAGNAANFKVVGLNGTTLSITSPTNGDVVTFTNSPSNHWVNKQPPQQIPVISGVNHASVAVGTSYTTIASVTLTVPSAAVATIDCTAAAEWAVVLSASQAHTLAWGISQNSTAAPTTARGLIANAATNNLLGGSMVESYPGTSGGTYTYRILASDATTTGTTTLVGDLLCIQH